jgi:tight adherence protein C
MIFTEPKIAIISDQTYFPICIGAAHFGLYDTCILVLALSVSLLSAFNLWRIGRYEDRERRFDALGILSLYQQKPSAEQTPWFHWLGTVAAMTHLVDIAKRERLLAALVAAGIKGQNRLVGLLACKVGVGAAFVALAWLILTWQQLLITASGPLLAVLAGALIIGWRFPDVVLARLVARRRARLELGIPDALDLLVICAEAGLSLDQAIEQVSYDLRSSNREVAEELAATAAEMRILADRSRALENLARRTGLSSLRSIIATLNQSIRFGTPLATSLRVLAADIRVARLARFEERAARLPALLTIPLMTLILPALMIVICTPLVLRILDVFEEILVRGN